jgi:predicted site-specific integrase-resolvase
MTTKQLLTTDDVADILDVAPSTLARWRQTGDPYLPFLRMNGRIRYRTEDVYDFLDDADDDDDVDEYEKDGDDDDETDDS